MNYRKKLTSYIHARFPESHFVRIAEDLEAKKQSLTHELKELQTNEEPHESPNLTSRQVEICAATGEAGRGRPPRPSPKMAVVTLWHLAAFRRLPYQAVLLPGGSRDLGHSRSFDFYLLSSCNDSASNSYNLDVSPGFSTTGFSFCSAYAASGPITTLTLAFHGGNNFVHVYVVNHFHTSGWSSVLGSNTSATVTSLTATASGAVTGKSVVFQGCATNSGVTESNDVSFTNLIANDAGTVEYGARGGRKSSRALLPPPAMQAHIAYILGSGIRNVPVTPLIERGFRSSFRRLW